MQTPSFGNAKLLQKPIQKFPDGTNTLKQQVQPLSFEAKPGLNFVFGHQLVATPSNPTRQPLLKPYNSARDPVGKTAKIDLSKFLTPAKPAQEDPEEKTPSDDDGDTPNGMPGGAAAKVEPLQQPQVEPESQESEGEQYVEVNMASDSESSENEVNDKDLELVKKHLNERAETQKTTISLKTTADRTDRGPDTTATPASAASKQRQLEEFVEKMRDDIAQYRQIVEQNNAVIKAMNEDYKKAKEKYTADLDSLNRELSATKADLKVKTETLSKTESFLAEATKLISENRGVLKTIANMARDTLKIADDPALLDQERLVKYQLAANYASQVVQKIDFVKLDNFLKDRDMSAPVGAAAKGPIATKISGKVGQQKYEQQLHKLKAENEVMSQQATELEKFMGALQHTSTARDSSGLCWGLQEVVTLRKEKDDLTMELKDVQEKYKKLLLRPIKATTNVNKLAQILAYLPKRKRELKIVEERRIREIYEGFEKERKGWEKEREGYKAKITELGKTLNELLAKLAESGKHTEGVEKENTALKQKTVELLGIIKLKDDQLNSLRQDLELARQQLQELLNKIDKLIQDSHAKDLLFADKMREMKAIFEDMLKEKEQKQKEIILLTQRISDLEKLISELKAALCAAQAENDTLRQNNAQLLAELDEIRSPEKVDGFKAMVALANMILARTKRPPPLSQQEKDAIKHVFEGHISELLEEIGNLRDEGKFLREELRKCIAEKNIPRSLVRLIIV